MRIFLLFLTIILSVPSNANAQQLPPQFNKVEFFGDILALMGFCGLWHHVDQYEMASAMKAFGVTAADRAGIEATRDRIYQTYRDNFKTAKTHGDFCIKARSHPFFTKAGRSGSPSFVGSDTKKQPEKIELFGRLLGAMQLCKMQVDGNKWGLFLSDMGVKSESVAGISEQARNAQQVFLAERPAPEKLTEFCNQTRADPYIARFSN